MDFTHIHGKRTTLHYYEMTPLDKAIDAYQKKAEQYFATKNEIENAPADVRKQREIELRKIKDELEHQRMNAESYASIQAQLDAYREVGRTATKGNRSEVVQKQRTLHAEDHHTTAVLEEMMRADGIPKPSSQHTAHHVIPGTGKTKNANLARVHMHRFGVRINDPDNGVYLPMYKKYTPHWSMPDSKGHLEYHTEGYEDWVRRKIQVKSGETFIRMELKLIGELLKINKLPDEARKKK